MLHTSTIFNLPVSIGAYTDFLEKIRELSSRKKSGYICVANVHMFMEAQKDQALRKSIKEAAIVTPDGVPLCWSLKWLRGIDQVRVAGMDLLPDLLRHAQQWNRRYFIYGGTDVLLQQTMHYLKDHFPDLSLAGTYSPPFRALRPNEEEEVIQYINQSKADIVLVVLGCPKQEKWMHSMQGRIEGLMIGIGGALPVMIGNHRRAPRWMQQAGLEWLFRLMQEPKRLFSRYLKTNSAFFYHFFRAFFATLFNRKAYFK